MHYTKIIDAGADYTLALKGSHKTLNEDVELLFDTTNIDKTEKSNEYYFEVEKEHGRITERIYDVIPVNENNLEVITEWKGLKAIGRVVTNTLRDGKESSETRHFLLRLFR